MVQASMLIVHHLGRSQSDRIVWLCEEDFTAADIMMVYPLTTARLAVQRDLSGCPNIRAYLQRIGARPGFKRARQKGDPGIEPNLT
jgi:glutathione S-transferase